MPSRGPSNVYVYYRVAADTAAARAAVAALFAAVAAETGVAGHLLARCDDPATWMEVYAPIARRAAFVRALAALVRRLRIADIAADGVRHTECFAPPGAVPRRRAPAA